MATAPYPAGSFRPTPPRATQQGESMRMFAAVMLGVLALFNGLDGIAAIAQSKVFVGDARFVFGDLRAWGWAMLALAVAQGFAAAGVLARNQLARWFGVAVLVLNAFAQMAFIPSYPVWSVLVIAIDVIALYALIAYGGRPEPGPPAS
ncbi:MULTISPECIES: hypothetical protein [Streptomycetaceae]|uniref:DUF7144 family membrane protein n=1 Tax=Streptomycetaceae TaxID=2062 RepID=UPI000693CC49|nr:hypothetical protein [Streptomyces sp. NRRL B-24484]